MSAARQLKSYLVILNAYQHDIDRLSADLSSVRASQAELEEKIVYLDHRRDTEGTVVSVEAAPFLAGFLQAIAGEKAALRSALDSLTETADALEEQVREKYLAAQSWKVICDRLRARMRAAELKQEGVEMDEVGRNIFTFNQSP